MDSKSKVYFFFDSTRLTLPNRTVLKKFIESIFKRERTKLAKLNYVFCTDEKLLEMNKQYLSHDYYTDIITFDFSDASSPTEGEVYISTDRVRENALSNKVTLGSEILRVVFHGALHLCGYRDKTRAEQAEMRAKEDFYIKRFWKSVPREKR